MAEYVSVGTQTVNPGESVVYNIAVVPCNRGLVRPRLGSGNLNLKGWVPSNYGCSCIRNRNAIYLAEFGANIAIPDGETVGPISLAFALDGGTIEASSMIATPTAVQSFYNVSRTKNISVLNGCCQTLTVRNTSSIPILVSDPSIVISRPDLAITR